MESNYYCVSVEYTKKFGIVKATIISRIEFWCDYHKENKSNDKFNDGYWWSGYMSYSDIVEQTGLPYKTVRNNIQEILKDGIIIRGRFNKKGYDKTSWYRINDVPGAGITTTLSGYNQYPEKVQHSTLSGYNEYPERVEVVPGMGAPIPVNPVNHFESSVITPVITPVNQELLEKIERIFDYNLASIVKCFVEGTSLTRIQRTTLNEKREELCSKIKELKTYLKEEL